MPTILGEVAHNTERYANNRVEASISLAGKGNGKCADSNLLVKPNGSCLFTASSRTFSEWDAHAESHEPSTVTVALVRHLADRDSSLRPLHESGPLRIKTTNSCSTRQC